MIVSNLLNPGNKYIKTFDFKTLYTKIPHNKLKWACGVVVSMFDFHRSDRGSNPSRGGKFS